MKLSISKKFILLLFGCLFFLSACGEEQPTPEPTAKAEFTLMVYMCGSNLETDFGAGTNAVKEMLEAELPEGVNICFEFGGARKWHYPNIPSKSNSYAAIEDKNLKILEYMQAENMGSVSTMEAFIKWSVENYPAENYGLLFWNHGGGSVAGVCKDELFNYDYLEIPEIGQCLKYGSELIGKRFEFICFDACLMANYETAKTISPYADYMLASEEALSSGGFEYKKSLTKLGQADFREYFTDCYIEKSISKNKNIYTISCVDLTEMDKLESAFDGFVEKIKDYDARALLKAAEAAEHLGSAQRKVYSNQLDLGSFAGKLGQEQIVNTLSQILTVKNGPLCGENSGLSFFFPLCSSSDTEDYMKAAYNSGYNSFLEKFLEETSQSTINFVSAGKNKGDRLEVVLTEESKEQVLRANCRIYLQNAEGEWELVGENADVDSEMNSLYAGVPASLLALDDIYIPAQVYQETAKYTEYRIPVQVNGQEVELFIGYEKNSDSLFMEGYVIDEETTLESRLTELKENDRLTIVNTSDFDWVKPVSFDYKSNQALQLRKSPEGAYRLQMEIYDMNMDVFYSDCIDINYAYN